MYGRGADLNVREAAAFQASALSEMPAGGGIVPLRSRQCRLRCTIGEVDNLALLHHGVALLSANPDLLRQALLHAVSVALTEQELVRWEAVFGVSGYRADEYREPFTSAVAANIAAAAAAATSVITEGLVDAHNIPLAATIGVVQQGASSYDADSAAAALVYSAATAEAFARFDAATRRALLQEEQLAVHTIGLTVSELERPESAPCEHDGLDFDGLSMYGVDCSSEAMEVLDELSDYPPPEAAANCPAVIANFVWAPSSDADSTTISMGQWLAVQQELRLKDFAIGQLERQLGFERGCNEWLASEWWSREQREEQISSLAAGLTGHPDAPVLVGIAVDAYQGEDERVEELFRRHNSGYWSGEAQSVDQLYDAMEMRCSEDQAELSGEESIEYDASVRHMVRHLVGSFHSRRLEAQQHQEQRLRGLQHYHDKVRRRHLRTCVTPAEPGNETSVNHTAGRDDAFDHQSWDSHSDAAPLVESPLASAVDNGEHLFNPGADFDSDDEDDGFLSDASTRAGPADGWSVHEFSEDDEYTE